MKHALSFIASILVGLATCLPITAAADTINTGCAYWIRGSSVHASCTNTTNHLLTANLYVDCQPYWGNPHVTKPVGPRQTVTLDTKCGGWSTIKGVSAYVS